MKDITLVNLNMLYVRFTDGKMFIQNHLILGPLYWVSALENNGISVDFRDYQMIDSEKIFDIEVFLNFIENPAPIIGFSCMANLLPFVLFALPKIKERYPNSTILLGGVGAAGIEMETMQRFPQLDVIHCGEGDVTVPLLIRQLLNNESIEDVPSIVYRIDNQVRINPKSERIQLPDGILFPAWDRLDMPKYQGYNILGSRGCPYPCTFCSITPIWGWKAYSRSNESIVEEMKILHERYGVQEFLFQDEYFVSNPKRIIDFCKLLKKSKLKIVFKAFARIDLVNRESLKALADAGCIELRFGIESGSDKILKLIKKGITSKQCLEQIALAKKYIPRVDAFYVWGFPYETMQDFSETIFQMITLRGMGINCLPSLLTYLPQTALYKELPDKSKLEFCPYLLPEYMVSGIENRLSVRVKIESEFQPLFDFIIENKDLFPGFFHIDIENNILPKLAMLEEFEFYSKEGETCGAHSPSQSILTKQ